jgi:hypothetical protein
MEDALVQDVKILDKLLNSPLLLDKYPVINYVSVERYGGIVDVVLIPNDEKEYFKLRDEIKLYVWNISKMAGVESRFNVYP